MFRKLVSNLPYSPTLVGQLGFYTRRLKKEQVTRKLGLIFTILALLVQSFALIQPPEAANAAGYRDNSANSIIQGGALSITELRQKYAQNPTHDLPTIYNYYHLSAQVVNNGQVKLGEAMKNGDVIVDGKVVARNNQSVGRSNLSGSHPISAGGKTYYESPSQTVFASNSISSFVFFDS